MYRLLYDDATIYDPSDDVEVVTDAKLSQSGPNSAAYLDFKITMLHPLYNILAEKKGSVRLFANLNGKSVKMFEGLIETIETEFNGTKSIAAVSNLNALGDTLVRPYSSVEGEEPLLCPSSVAGYFQWLIEQHNARMMDGRKQFTVDVNQGNALKDADFVYFKSDSLPTVANEISTNILTPFGGYLFLRYGDDGVSYLDLYADVHDMNAQIIDFGVNLLDFTRTTDVNKQYTALRPQGGTLENEKKPIDISGLPDGTTEYNTDIVKYGDVIYSVSMMQRYGYREYAYSDSDEKDTKELLKESVTKLVKLCAPTMTIEVKAIDLALYMPDYQHLQVGQAVRIRSALHQIDEYLMVSSIDLDLNEPDKTTYVLGTSYDTLTGQQSGYLKSLNDSINSSLDAAASISGDLAQLTDKAIVDTTYQYAASDSDSVAPEEGWSSKMPSYIAGKYLWQRPLVTYGSGVVEVKEPVMITGNSAASLKINSSQGNTFKNGNVDTDLTVKVFYGAMVITTLADLKLLYGDTVTLHWRYQPFGQDDFIDIASNDPRLTNNGFTLKVTSSEVTNKAVFQCIIDA
jgi:hypothetical protein